MAIATLSSQFLTSTRHIKGTVDQTFVHALPSLKNAREGIVYTLFNADGSVSENIYDRNGGTGAFGQFVRLRPKVTYAHLVRDVQTLTGTSVTAGTFTLTATFASGATATTVALPFNATAAAIVAALATIGVAVTATGGPINTTPVVLTGASFGPITALTVSNASLTGTIANVHTTTGSTVPAGDIMDGDINYDIAASNAVSIANNGGLFA
jgi:hypothetical protein